MSTDTTEAYLLATLAGICNRHQQSLLANPPRQDLLLVYICVYVYVYVCICVCMYMCVCICMYMCMYVYVHVCMYINVYMMYVCIYGHIIRYTIFDNLKNVYVDGYY